MIAGQMDGPSCRSGFAGQLFSNVSFIKSFSRRDAAGAEKNQKKKEYPGTGDRRSPPGGWYLSLSKMHLTDQPPVKWIVFVMVICAGARPGRPYVA